MYTFLKFSLCISILAFFSACEKNQSNITNKPHLQKAASGIIESHLGYSTAKTLKGVASIKFQAGRIPANNGPSPGYVAPDLGKLSVEEAIYYIEAAHNFDANKDAKWSRDNEMVSIPFSIPLVSSGSSEIDQDDVVAAYDNLYDQIISRAPVGKEVLVVNVYGLQINQNDVDFEMDVLYVPIGGGSTTAPLSSSDNWKAFLNQGKCFGGGSGDATTRLESLINWYGIAGWNGSSASSNGGMALLCANGWPRTFTDVECLPSCTTYYENGSLTQWPVTSCNVNLCLNQADMESNLVHFFNYTNNTLLTGSYANYTMIYGIYDNSSGQAPVGGACYQTGIQYRHKVRWQVGVQHCDPLPW